MQRHGQFYNSKIGGKMTATHRNFFNNLTANFRGQLLQLGNCQSTQLLRAINSIKNPGQRFSSTFNKYVPCKGGAPGWQASSRPARKDNDYTSEHFIRA